MNDNIFRPEHPPNFPKMFMEIGGYAKDGSRVIGVCGGRYDKDQGGYKTFVKRSCFVMDEIFPREEEGGYVTFLIYSKGEEGLKNEAATVSFPCHI